MRFVSEEITKYCIDHSTPPSPTCQALESYTKENVEGSIMLSGPLEGSLLGFLIRTIPAKRVLEIGTYTGYCALNMASYLPVDGEVITLDVDPKTAAIAKQHWDKDPNGRKVHQILGPALETLDQLKGPFDLVFLDAIKREYLDYFKKVLPLLSPNGIIVADNALMDGEVLHPSPSSPGVVGIKQFNEYVRSRPDLMVSLLPLRDGVSLIRKR